MLPVPTAIAALLACALLLGAAALTSRSTSADGISQDPQPPVSQSPVPSPSTAAPNTPAATEQWIADTYLDAFNEPIVRPAIHANVPGACVKGLDLTSTAYVRPSGSTSTLLTVRVLDGVITRKTRRTVLTPAGRIRVLVVLIRYPETWGDNGERRWLEAQASINEDHAAFARRRGYADPLVVFDNTNVVLDHPALTDPRVLTDVRDAARARDVRTEDYQAIMTIDLDPKHFAGGRAFVSTRSIYMGNYSHWTTPLDARSWRGVASAAYNHEMGHLWGWEHDWTPSCGKTGPPHAPFITAPVLFGWEDVDGDQIPEIVDPTPYGQVARPTP